MCVSLLLIHFILFFRIISKAKWCVYFFFFIYVLMTIWLVCHELHVCYIYLLNWSECFIYVMRWNYLVQSTFLSPFFHSISMCVYAVFFNVSYIEIWKKKKLDANRFRLFVRSIKLMKRTNNIHRHTHYRSLRICAFLSIWAMQSKSFNILWATERVCVERSKSKITTTKNVRNKKEISKLPR